MPKVSTRREFLRKGLAGAGVGLTGLAGCVAPPQNDPPSDGALLSEGFEEEIPEWRTRAHIGPEVDLSEFEWSAERSREQAHSGEWSLAIYTEGDYDDGTAWATRSVRPPAGAQKFRVTLSAWSESESFNILRNLVASLGPEAPTAEEDFPAPEENSTGDVGAPAGGLRSPLHQREGWLTYTFEWEPESVPEELFLAVGVSVVWEAGATHYIDDVRVEVLA
jgi:hypothetical protein